MKDRSKRPRLTANEQTAMANCNMPLEIAERRAKTSERQWGTLELMGCAHWQKDATTEGGEEKVVAHQVSPKPPPPEAPTAYWEDPREEKGAEIGKWKDSKGKEFEGKHCKGKDSKGKDDKGKDSKGKEAKGKDGNGGKSLGQVEEDREAARSSYSSQTAR